MGRFEKMMWLEMFRTSKNDETIDDLQLMAMTGMFDDDDNDDFGW